MKPIIYRITHLWPNKQPGQGLTAQIEEERGLVEALGDIAHGDWDHPDTPRSWAIEVLETVPDRSSTVQIKPETDEPNALPSRFVSLQDYEALERAANRVLILDDAEPSEDSEAHVAVIAELRAALSSEATKGKT